MGGPYPGIYGGFLNTQDQLLRQQQQRQLLAQEQMRAEQQRRAQAAQGAYFNTLTTPDMAALPQQGAPPPGMGAQPGPPTGPPPGTPPPGPPQGPQMGPGPSAPPPPQTPPGPTPGPPGPGPSTGGGARPPGPAAGGLQIPDPIARLSQLAQRIKATNPGMDNATLAMALEQTVNAAKGLSGEDRALLQAETQIMRIQAQADAAIQRASSAAQVAQIRAEATMRSAEIRAQTAEALGGARIDAYRDAFRTASEDRRRGQDLTHEDRQAAESGRAQRAMARIDGSAATAQAKARYKVMVAKRQEVNDQISAFNAGLPGAPDRKAVEGLQKQKLDLDRQITSFWSQNQALPRPSEILGADQPQSTGGAPAAAGGAPQPGGGQQEYKIDQIVETPKGKVKVVGFDKDGHPLVEPAFQDGGEFTVGGTGGPDSQTVKFKATPGEKVTITPEMAERGNAEVFRTAGKAQLRKRQKSLEGGFDAQVAQTALGTRDAK